MTPEPATPEPETSESARPLAVVDIDGVVADVRHRLAYLQSRPKDWDGFFAAAADDPPIPDGVAAAAYLAGGHDVVWLTGRPERLRAVTGAWLSAHGLPAAELHMRADADHRPARRLKAELLKSLADGRKVAVVLDDDPEVVTALVARGWPAQLTTWVPRDEPLRDAQEKQGRS